MQDTGQPQHATCHPAAQPPLATHSHRPCSSSHQPPVLNNLPQHRHKLWPDTGTFTHTPLDLLGCPLLATSAAAVPFCTASIGCPSPSCLPGCPAQLKTLQYIAVLSVPRLPVPSHHLSPHITSHPLAGPQQPQQPPHQTHQHQPHLRHLRPAGASSAAHHRAAAAPAACA